MGEKGRVNVSSGRGGREGSGVSWIGVRVGLNLLVLALQYALYLVLGYLQFGSEGKSMAGVRRM